MTGFRKLEANFCLGIERIGIVLIKGILFWYLCFLLQSKRFICTSSYRVDGIAAFYRKAIEGFADQHSLLVTALKARVSEAEVENEVHIVIAIYVFFMTLGLAGFIVGVGFRGFCAGFPKTYASVIDRRRIEINGA